ncbi:MAG: TatD family hydrolase [bacterium]
MKSLLIDTHAHLQLEHFEDDRDEVVRRAAEAGVASIICVSTDLPSSRQAIALAEKHANVFAAVGIHPNDCGTAGDKDFLEVAELSRHAKVVAIGEVGLDYYWKNVDPKTQGRTFVKQLELAQQLDKPVIIHNREASEDILKTLQEAGLTQLRGVFHCFSENTDYAERVLALGCHISFTGNLTYKKSILPAVAERIPLERLLLETDCPFMSPVPFRGKRNEPAFTIAIAEKLASIKNVDVAEVCRLTSANAAQLFALPDGLLS